MKYRMASWGRERCRRVFAISSAQARSRRDAGDGRAQHGLGGIEVAGVDQGLAQEAEGGRRQVGRRPPSGRDREGPPAGIRPAGPGRNGGARATGRDRRPAPRRSAGRRALPRRACDAAIPSGPAPRPATGRPAEGVARSIAPSPREADDAGRIRRSGTPSRSRPRSPGTGPPWWRRGSRPAARAAGRRPPPPRPPHGSPPPARRRGTGSRRRGRRRAATRHDARLPGPPPRCRVIAGGLGPQLQCLQVVRAARFTRAARRWRCRSCQVQPTTTVSTRTTIAPARPTASRRRFFSSAALACASTRASSACLSLSCTPRRCPVIAAATAPASRGRSCGSGARHRRASATSSGSVPLAPAVPGRRRDRRRPPAAPARRRCAHERRLAREDLAEDGAEPEDVGPLVDPVQLAPRLLGRHVAGRAHHRAGPRAPTSEPDRAVRTVTGSSGSASARADHRRPPRGNTLARPQSITCTSPKLPTITLDGFRSR